MITRGEERKGCHKRKRGRTVKEGRGEEKRRRQQKEEDRRIRKSR